MLSTIRKAWGIEELRRKMIFTLIILILYRVGNAIPVPYVDTELLRSFFNSVESTALGLLNTMSGSALSYGTIFALGIQPYITSSIIIQLLTIAIPALERLQRDGGEDGKKKVQAITRYVTLAISLLLGLSYYYILSQNSLLTSDASGFLPPLIIILSFSAGSCLLMWMGEQITEFGIGNGISIVLFAGIISRFPSNIATTAKSLISGDLQWYVAVLLLIGALAMIVLIVVISNSERRIPVQYSKRVVGRKMYGGQSTHLPIKLNMSGVMPIIFAQSIASLPATIATFASPKAGGFWEKFLAVLNTNTITYAIIYLLLIIFFSYFYAAIQFNPVEVANNLKKNGGFIPGFRAGRPTSEYIQKVLSKVTIFGAIYLAIIAVAPIIIGVFSEVASQTGIQLGGTSIIIVVGVALETIKSMESQMLMRHYKGFLE